MITDQTAYETLAPGSTARPWVIGGLVAVVLTIIAQHIHRIFIMAVDQPGIQTDFAINTEQAVFHVPMVLALAVILNPKPGWITFLGCVIVGHLLNETALIHHHLHTLLDRLDLYPLAFRHGRPDVAVNVQYAGLMVWMVLAVGLVWRLVVRRTRTRHRLFLCLMMGVCLGTTLLFHKLVVEYALQGAVAEARAHRRAVVAEAMALPSRLAFVRMCASVDVTCTEGSWEDGPWSKPGGVPSMHMHAMQASASVMRPGDMAQEVAMGSLVVPDLRGNQFVLMRRGDRYRLGIDNSSYNPIVYRHKHVFAALMVAAHTWWLGGGMLLLSWHDRRWRGRRARPSVRA